MYYKEVLNYSMKMFYTTISAFLLVFSMVSVRHCVLWYCTYIKGTQFALSTIMNICLFMWLGYDSHMTFII